MTNQQLTNYVIANQIAKEQNSKKKEHQIQVAYYMVTKNKKGGR